MKRIVSDELSVKGNQPTFMLMPEIWSHVWLRAQAGLLLREDHSLSFPVSPLDASL